MQVQERKVIEITWRDVLDMNKERESDGPLVLPYLLLLWLSSLIVSPVPTGTDRQMLPKPLLIKALEEGEEEGETTSMRISW
jgi:hypothetical protein